MNTALCKWIAIIIRSIQFSEYSFAESANAKVIFFLSSYVDPQAVVGCEDGKVRVFDMYSRKISQIIKYVCYFDILLLIHILSILWNYSKVGFICMFSFFVSWWSLPLFSIWQYSFVHLDKHCCCFVRSWKHFLFTMDSSIGPYRFSFYDLRNTF